MQILVDADALPRPIKDILFRAAERLQITLIMVANTRLKVPKSKVISMKVVDDGIDMADHWIAEKAEEGDLVITADIPLAARVIEKGATALGPRGQLYTSNNIKQKLSIRNFMDELRGGGVHTGGPAPFTNKDNQAFANQLDRFLTQRLG